jgi:hypothetical protein
VAAAQAPADLRADSCGVPGFCVSASDPGDLDTACEAVAEATAFLGGFGLDTRLGLKVVFVDPVAPAAGEPAWGLFDGATGAVRVIPFATRPPRARRPLGLPWDRALHRSLIVHELAHAIARHNAEGRRLSVAAQEYIAYVTQLATLPAPHRRVLLARSHYGAFEHPGAITSLYFYLDPDAFAVKSYLHFRALEHPAGFVRGLVAGTVPLGDE